MNIIYIDECNWPGPEDPGVEAMVMRHQELIDSLCSGNDSDKFNQSVISLIETWKIPEGDAWDIDTLKYWIKAWIIQLSDYSLNKANHVPEWLTTELQVVNDNDFPVGYKATDMKDILVIKNRG